MISLVRGLLAIAVSLALLLPAAADGAAVQVSQSGWAWGNPRPQGNSINALDFNGGRGFAVGEAGTALRTDDGGSTWQGLPTGTTASLYRLQVVTPDVVTILGGDGCALRRSVNGGRSFSRLYVTSEKSCPNPVATTFFVTAASGYLVLKDGSVLRTTDGGQSFSKQTAIPGTSASTGAGQARPQDVWFTSERAGYALTSAGLYSTSDAGVSWTPIDPKVHGDGLHLLFVSPTVAYAYGGPVLSRSDDGGATWTVLPASGATGIVSLRCATVDTCVAVPKSGATLLRTTDGGQNFSPITPSTRAINAAAFASPTRVVAVGSGGVTVTSDDGGTNFTPVGGDIGGSFLSLARGTMPSTAFALGNRGSLAQTTDSGASWALLSVPTSSTLTGVSFASPTTGYTVDNGGGLFKTANGGSSWQTLDPGTNGDPLFDVTTIGANTVLVLSRTGIRRQVATGGRFDPVGGKAIKSKGLVHFDAAGGLVTAWGTKAIALSDAAAGNWKAIPIPNPEKSANNHRRLAAVDFTGARTGYAADTRGRLFHTANAGTTWTEITSVGTPITAGVSFSDDAHGFAAGKYAADTGGAYVLRTSDGGKTWRPQRLAVGKQAFGGVLGASAGQAYALLTPDGNAASRRQLFSTTTGGDAGSVSSLTVTTRTKTLTASALRKAKGAIIVTGTLRGAQGGEQIAVAAESATGTIKRLVVTAGANGGSFTAKFTITGTTSFVAQWAGDSGRQGVGTAARKITIKPDPKKKKKKKKKH